MSPAGHPFATLPRMSSKEKKTPEVATTAANLTHPLYAIETLKAAHCLQSHRLARDLVAQTLAKSHQNFGRPPCQRFTAVWQHCIHAAATAAIA